MNTPTYINNAHKALSRNPDGLTLEEIAGKLRTKVLKVSPQIRALHDAGLIETFEEAGQPVYKLKAAPVAESGRAQIPPPQYDPASVAFPAADAAIPTKTYGPSVLRAIVSDLSGDSEGGETDAPAVDAQREEFTLLGLLADIRAAAGDPSGKLMQDELVQHIAGVVKERDDLRERLDAQIQQWQTDTGRLAADLRAAMESRSRAINEADRLRAELAAERQAREALQEQSGVIQAAGYVLKAPKRLWRSCRNESSAKSIAMAAARRGFRIKAFALVPIGEASPGAEWRDA